MTVKAISGTDTRDYDRLLPCPFCGGEATAIETYPGRGELYCGNCDVVMVGNNAMTPDELTAAWNTRTERTCENGMPRSYNYLECSLCGALTYQGKAEFNYCPNCGAKVVGQ